MNKALQQRVVEYVNLGAVGKRGRPVKLGSEASLRRYPEALFENNYQPDCVLIDGRFRVACFLQTLISSAPGTKIIFDDYPFREQYHVVEDFAQKADATKTQAMFIRPEKIDVKTISAALAEFIFVPD